MGRSCLLCAEQFKIVCVLCSKVFFLDNFILYVRFVWFRLSIFIVTFLLLLFSSDNTCISIGGTVPISTIQFYIKGILFMRINENLCFCECTESITLSVCVCTRLYKREKFHLMWTNPKKAVPSYRKTKRVDDTENQPKKVSKTSSDIWWKHPSTSVRKSNVWKRKIQNFLKCSCYKSRHTCICKQTNKQTHPNTAYSIQTKKLFLYHCI